MTEPQRVAPLIGIKETPSSEFTARLDLFRGRMVALGVDVAVVTTPSAVFHLAGLWTGSNGASPVLLVTQTGHRVLNRRLDMGWLEMLRGTTWATDWIAVDDHEETAAIIAANILDLQAGLKVGAECNSPLFTAPFSAAFSAALDGSAPQDIEPTLLDLRARKSPTEIALMRRAAPLTSLAFDTARDALARGMTDADASAAAYAALLSTRPEPLAYHPIVVSGVYNRAVHAPFGGVRPGPSEPTTMMMSGIHGGYAAPLERTFFQHHIPERAKPKLASVIEAINHVMQRIEPGMTGAQVDALSRTVHERNGFADNFLHRTGYSTGLFWADLSLMQLHRGETRRIEPGMTFHLVPHLYDEELGLISVSQPIVVTEQGCETIIDYPFSVDPID